MIFPEPAGGPPDVLANFDSSDAYQQGLNARRHAALQRSWSTRLGVSQDWFHTDNYNSKRVQTTEYSNHGLSPTASLMFKPAANMTTYVTYASSLQAGDLAPARPANAGDSLPPYRSKRIRAGLQGVACERSIRPRRCSASSGRSPTSILPTTSSRSAASRSTRAWSSPAVGEIVGGLTLYGGVTLLDARLEDTPLVDDQRQDLRRRAQGQGQRAVRVPLPGVPGLIATFDYQFSGDRAGNDTQLVLRCRLQPLRHRRALHLEDRHTTVTWRLAVDNVTDRHYWSTVAPSNLTRRQYRQSDWRTWERRAPCSPR